MTLVVKNTFLEFAPYEDTWGVERKSRRASTGPAYCSSQILESLTDNLDTDAGSSVESDVGSLSWTLENMCPTEEDPCSLEFPDQCSLQRVPVDLDGTSPTDAFLWKAGFEAGVLERARNKEHDRIADVYDSTLYHQPYSQTFVYEAQSEMASPFLEVPFGDESVDDSMRLSQRAESSHRGGSLSESPQRKRWSMQGEFGFGQRDSISESPRRKQWSKTSPVNERFLQSPKRTHWSGDSSAPESGQTTVMLRNLPNDYDRGMLMELLESKGFSACFDFVYLPFDFRKHAGLGYAFVNLVTPQEVLRAMTELAGFNAWRVKSQKVLQVTWSKPLQGLEANIERYRNSPVMHPEVPECFKPMLFLDGVRVDFPAPTKVLQMPNLH